MADETVKAWQKISKQLAGQLPGEWSIGRSGIKTLLVRQPVEWTVLWIGIGRVRRDDRPRLLGGITPLVREFDDVSVMHGVSMPVRPGGPVDVDLTTPDAIDTVREFADLVLERTADWTPERLAAEAEEQLAQAPDDRGTPLTFPDAAGWRVVLGTGDPVGPAREAAAWWEKAAAPEAAPWYRNLADAWETGGRPAALQFLEKTRDAAVESLKLK